MAYVNQKWWQSAVVYQIYPRSFQDTNEDGIGDIQGIIQRLNYIHSLGVNVIWLNPIFISPQIDNGYDISNYYRIDPIFGTMSDVEELIEKAHQLGIKLMFDFVLNHTSDQHPWFQEALHDPDSLYRDYYLWADEKKAGQLPNNWASFFGGSVWEKAPNRKDYYFHLFAKEMPDLNWKNPEVRVAMLNIAKFWLAKGVDAFRLDAFIHIAKEKDYPDVANVAEGKLAIAEEFYSNLPEVHEYLSDFIEEVRRVKPDVFIVGEAASADVDLAVAYTDPTKDECDAVISFRHFVEDESQKDPLLPSGMQKGSLDYHTFKKVMAEWQIKLASIGGPTLYWNNHDMARIASRFGDERQEFRKNSSKMLATLMYLQKGIPFILYGEELGMLNLKMKDLAAYEDPGAVGFYEEATNLGYSDSAILEMLNSSSKDVSRGAMQWDASDYSGFSKVAPWSGVNQSKEDTVATEEIEKNSVLNYYRKMIALKKTSLFTTGVFQLQETSDEFYCYTRSIEDSTANIYCNLTDTPKQMTCSKAEQAGTVLLENEGNYIQNQQIHLAPYGCLVIHPKGE